MFLEYFIHNLTDDLTAGSGTVFEDSFLLIEQSDFLAKRSIHVATDNRINVKMYDPTKNQNLFRGSDDLRHISGTSLSGITSYGFVPFNWPIPYQFKLNTRVKISYADASSAPNTIYQAYHGDSILPVPPLDMYGQPVDYTKEQTGKLSRTPIIYESPAITPGTSVGNTASQVILIDDADFVCTAITGISTGTGFVTIRDEKRGLYWQNQKTHVQNLFGNGQFPNRLTSPRFIKRNSAISITFENLAGGANSLNLYLHGYLRGGR